MFLVLMIKKGYPNECTFTSFINYETGEGIFSGAAILVKIIFTLLVSGRPGWQDLKTEKKTRNIKLKILIDIQHCLGVI